MKTASDLSRLIGDRAAAAEYGKRAEASRKAIMRRLFDARTATFYGGLDWKGRAVEHDTAHAYALSVVSGLAPEYDERFVTEKLLPLVRGELRPMGGVSEAFFHLGRTPSPFFMYYVFEALKSADYGADVVDCIKRWWGEFLEWGVTTTPEVWQPPKGHGSACHAWSAHPIVHFCATILGVSQSAVGWKRIDFAPVFYGDHASGAVATPLGQVEVGWKREGGAVSVTLRVPKGMKARVSLPGVRKTVAGGRHSWTVET